MNVLTWLLFSVRVNFHLDLSITITLLLLLLQLLLLLLLILLLLLLYQKLLRWRLWAMNMCSFFLDCIIWGNHKIIDLMILLLLSLRRRKIFCRCSGFIHKPRLSNVWAISVIYCIIEVWVGWYLNISHRQTKFAIIPLKS